MSENNIKQAPYWGPVRKDAEYFKIVEAFRKKAEESQPYPLWSKLFSYDPFDLNNLAKRMREIFQPFADLMRSECKIWAVWRPNIDDPAITFFEEVKTLLSADIQQKVRTVAPLYVEGLNPGAFAIELLDEFTVLFDHRLFWVLKSTWSSRRQTFARAWPYYPTESRKSCP